MRKILEKNLKQMHIDNSQQRSSFTKTIIIQEKLLEFIDIVRGISTKCFDFWREVSLSSPNINNLISKGIETTDYLVMLENAYEKICELSVINIKASEYYFLFA